MEVAVSRGGSLDADEHEDENEDEDEDDDPFHNASCLLGRRRPDGSLCSVQPVGCTSTLKGSIVIVVGGGLYL